MLRGVIDKATADAVTLAIAVLGAALGVLNFWRSWAADRVRVRVRVAHAYVLSGVQTHNLTIDVVNLSTFPVTVTHIGFDVNGTDRHMQIPMPIFTTHLTLPVRLESRAGFTVLQPLTAFKDEQLARLRNAYVLTACGARFNSSRSAFKQINAMAAAAADPPPLR